MSHDTNSSVLRTVIYHSGCPDGTCAAASAIAALGPVDCVPARHGDPAPDVTGHEVYILDFSYPRPVLEAMLDQSRFLIILDHHKTAAAALAGFPGTVFDMNRSGAGITWDTLATGPRPWIVNYVEDVDLWRFDLPESRAVAAWISTLTLDRPETWLPLLEETQVPESVLTAGRAILLAQQNWCARVAATAERGTIAGHDIPVVNAPHPLGSSVLELLYQGEPFAARWQRGPDGRYSYSLASSRSGIDVSAIATSFGGGGHEHASGFSSERLVHLD